MPKVKNNHQNQFLAECPTEVWDPFSVPHKLPPLTPAFESTTELSEDLFQLADQMPTAQLAPRPQIPPSQRSISEVTDFRGALELMKLARQRQEFEIKKVQGAAPITAHPTTPKKRKPIRKTSSKSECSSPRKKPQTLKNQCSTPDLDKNSLQPESKINMLCETTKTIQTLQNIELPQHMTFWPVCQDNLELGNLKDSLIEQEDEDFLGIGRLMF